MIRASHLLTFVRTATKKAGGSSKNGRKTVGKRLGVKKWQNQPANTSDILYRQRGTKFHPGFNVGMGRDHTLYALIPGFVKYYRVRGPRGKIRKYIGVEPFGFADTPAAADLPLLPH